MANIFVTGASGTIGSQVVAALNDKPGFTVAAAGRSSNVPFDYADPRTYQAADGHDAVFLLAPPLDPNAHRLVLPFVDYLAAHGQPHLTYLSAYGMDQLTDLPLHQLVEQRLLAYRSADGGRATILRPGFFATNFSNYERKGIEQRGMIYNPAGGGATAFVDPADVGRVAAATLTDPSHAGQVYTLTGPRAYTMQEVAALLSDYTDRSVVYPQPSDEEYRAALLSSGAPPFLPEYMIAVYGLIRQGRVGKVFDTVQQVTGRPATDLKDVLQRDFRDRQSR